MFRFFYPHEFAESVFTIDYFKLYSRGFRGLIFDVDNTLVHHGEDATDEIEQLFHTIHKLGLKTLLLTNNNDERVRRFNRNIGTLYICDADKPRIKNYCKSLEMLQVKKEEAVYIGDQLFTDILGANRSGIPSILVKYLRHDDEVKIGIRRNLEKIILRMYFAGKRFQNRLGNIQRESFEKGRASRKRKLFCEIHPLFYQISAKKEVIRRHINDFLCAEKFHSGIKKESLENIVSHHKAKMIKRSPGINPDHQYNKAENIELACRKINGIIIRPGEVFSFWRTIGKVSKKNGFKEGRIINNNKLISGIGGGLCNLANSLHVLILHSPMEVIEFHKHSDALAPDEGKRIPFSSGTSVSYNHVDYRFKNISDQDVQLLAWSEDEILHVELRSEYEFPWSYEIVEEDHHFSKIEGKYYRNSKIYRIIRRRSTREVLDKELILNNHSEVMYDYSLIPIEQKEQKEQKADIF